MSRRNILFTLLAILLLGSLGSVLLWRRQAAGPRKPEHIPQGDYSYTRALTAFRIEQLRARRHFPSVAAALIDDQEVLWQDAVGMADLEAGVPAAPNTIYRVWSVAKIFTALETMRLVEDGLVELDAPITTYIPDFSIQSRFPDPEPVTLRSLLTHRSGLPRNGCHYIGYQPDNPDLLGAWVLSLKDCFLGSPTGTRYKYSNVGVDLLGYLIQEVRGRPFAEHMQAELLAPIGMANSAFDSSGLPAGKAAAPGYEYYKGEYTPYNQGDIVNQPSGNLYSTLEDMSAFVQFIFRDGEAGGVPLIQPETVRGMYAEPYASPSDPQPMGLGWKTARVLGDELLVWHDGGPGDGTGALVALLPERKLGVVLVANEIGFEAASVSIPLALEILESMLETRYGLTPPEPEKPEPFDVDREILEPYTGRYIAYREAMEVSLSRDQLKGSIQGMTFDLVPVGEARFRLSHWLLKLGLADLLQLPIDLEALEITFQPNTLTGEIDMIIDAGGINYEICPRYPDLSAVPALWEDLVGAYNLSYRTSEFVALDTIGSSEIILKEKILKIPGNVAPILPVSETEIIILSGPFAGETMLYDPASGYISHQSLVYKPVKE